MKCSSSLPLDRYQHRHSCFEIFKTAASLLAQRFTNSRMITVRLPPPGQPGGINIQLASIRHRSNRSDSAAYCGRNIRGSRIHTGDPPRTRPPPLNHNQFVLIQHLSGQALIPAECTRYNEVQNFADRRLIDFLKKLNYSRRSRTCVLASRHYACAKWQQSQGAGAMTSKPMGGAPRPDGEVRTRMSSSTTVPALQLVI